MDYIVDEWIITFLINAIQKYKLKNTIKRCSKFSYFFIRYTKESIISKIKKDKILCLKLFLSYVKIKELIDICKQCNIGISKYCTRNKTNLINQIVKQVTK